MAIKVKRGQSANLSGATLVAGEPAFTLDTGKLYIGNGTDKVLINADNVATATKLAAAHNIAIIGDATGSASFDGSADASISLVFANSGVTAGTYTKLTVDAKGRVTSAQALSASDIPNLTLAKITDVGTAASKSTGTAAGNVPVLDAGGKLDVTVLPAITINNTTVVASESAMLALTAQTGDMAVRSDISATFVLAAEGASTLANWIQLPTPVGVSSVSGKTGVVTLTSSDVGLANVNNTADANKVVLSATKLATARTINGVSFDGTGNITVADSTKEPTIATKNTAFNVNFETTDTNIKVNGTQSVGSLSTAARGDHVHPTDSTRAPLASPTFTGTPAAPTATAGTNTTQVATTAFVGTALNGYISTSSDIDGGAF